MERIRAAGYNERRCISRDVLGLYGSIIVTSTYRRSTDIDVSPDQLKTQIFKGLKKCIEQHPALGTVILSAETEAPWLGRPPSLDLNRHFRMIETPAAVNDTHALETLLKTAHNEAFADRSLHPQWRLYAQPLTSTAGSTSTCLRLAFSYSHALADGMSGLTFHSSLLQALREVEALPYDSSAVCELSGGAVIPPALNSAGTFPISWSFLLSPLLSHYLPASIAKAFGFQAPMQGADGPWVGAAVRPALPTPPQMVSTSLKAVQIEHSTLQRLLVVSRKEKARLTGVLHQVVVRALAETLPKHGNQQTSKFAAQTALDLRRALGVGICMANYVSGATEVLEAVPADQRSSGLSESEWNSARKTTQRLQTASGTLSDQPIALLGYLNNYRGWTLSQAGKAAEESYSISNLGNFGIAKDVSKSSSKWDVCEAIFSQSADATGAPLNVNVASTTDGPLSITLSWLPGALGLENEDGFVEDVCTSMQKTIDNTAAVE